MKKLVKKAISSMEKAYAPYSNFNVGAALLDDRGQIHCGVNVENAAFPCGTCAEQSAISKMIVSGGKYIIKIAVAGKGKILCTPCGACRQRIREFGSKETEVIICNEQGVEKIFTIEDLLPQNFGPDNLN